MIARYEKRDMIRVMQTAFNTYHLIQMTRDLKH